MTNSKNTKRALLTSALSVVLCIAMLVGATFAWFTDSVTSSGNIIKSGTLKISAVWQDTDAQAAGEGYTIPGFDRAETIKFSDTETDINKENAIISEQLWEPGAVGAKLITVRNDGNLAAKIKLLFSVKDEGLQNALWFDFVQIKDGAVVGQFTKREMSALAALGEAMEFPLMPKGTAGDSLSFILLYGMKEEAGNEYQGKGFAADVTILATQYAHEADSFDEQYDKDAGYPVMVEDGTSDSLQKALYAVGNQGTVILTQDTSTTSNLNINRLLDNTPVDKSILINLNQKQFTTTNSNGFGLVLYAGKATISNGTMSTNDANGAFGVLAVAGGEELNLNNLLITNFKGHGLAIDGRSESTYMKLNDVTIHSTNGGGFTTRGTADLYDCTMTQTGFYNWNSNNVSVSHGGTVNIHSGNYTSENYGLYVYNSGGTINVYGGTFQADTVLKADYNKGASTINVYGGSFTGKLSIVPQATLYIEAGVFAGTGLTLDEFNAYVAQGSTVTESNGVFTVTKGN